jgi:SpoIIAA-like
VLKLIENLPPTVLGVEASGKVTHEDYRNVLIPNAEAMLAKGPIKMLYVIGDDFTGYEIEALWDDGAFGVKHWHDFRQIAVVTDHAWLRAAVTMFKPFFPHEVRLFRLSDVAAAKAWVTGAADASSTTIPR